MQAPMEDLSIQTESQLLMEFDSINSIIKWTYDILFHTKSALEPMKKVSFIRWLFELKSNCWLKNSLFYFCKSKYFLILELPENIFYKWPGLVLANLDWVLYETLYYEIPAIYSTGESALIICARHYLFLMPSCHYVHISTDHCPSTWYITCNHHIYIEQ